jgi:hypothetical protein
MELEAAVNVEHLRGDALLGVAASVAAAGSLKITRSGRIACVTWLALAVGRALAGHL